MARELPDDMFAIVWQLASAFPSSHGMHVGPTRDVVCGQTYIVFCCPFCQRGQVGSPAAQAIGTANPDKWQCTKCKRGGDRAGLRVMAERAMR